MADYTKDRAEALALHHHRIHGLCTHGETPGNCDVFNGPLNTLAARIHANAKAHGFWEEERNFGEMMALIHSEVSEALEEHRKGNPAVYYVGGGDNPDEFTGSPRKPEGSASELVDVIIRALDTLHSQNVDIDALALDKMKYNESRPYKHGKKY